MSAPTESRLALELTFGDRIHKLRKLLRMTQAEFALAIGTKPANIDAWERDRNLPRNVVQIARAIETRLDIQPRGWLLGYAEDDEKAPATMGGGLVWGGGDSNPEPDGYGVDIALIDFPFPRASVETRVAA